MFEFDADPSATAVPAGDAPAAAAAADPVDALAALAPGPVLLTSLLALDSVALPDRFDRVNVVAAWERVSCWVAAQQARAMAAAVGATPTDDDDFAREEVAAALGLSPGSADRRMEVARALATRLVDARRALAEGTIGYWHAVSLVEATEELDDAATARVQAALLNPRHGRADGRSLAEFRRALRRAVLRAAPAAAEAAHHDAATRRGVQTWPLPAGMAEFRATLTADGLATVTAALDAWADRLKTAGNCGGADGGASVSSEASASGGSGGARDVDARRADALVAIARAALADPTLPTRHGQRPHIALTVSLDTVLGLDDAPGELAGYGPVPASLARTLAADGQWRRFLTEPATGRLLDAGRTTYRPPAALANYIVARDRTCRFPTCGRPAARCHLDHTVPYDAGGPTSRTNLGALCARHHRLKHEAGWTLVRHDDESCTWTSPTGRSYHVPLPSYGPDP